MLGLGFLKITQKCPSVPWSSGDNFKVLSLREYNLQQAYRSRPAGVLRDDPNYRYNLVPTFMLSWPVIRLPWRTNFNTSASFQHFQAGNSGDATGRKKNKDHAVDAFFDVFNLIKMMLTCEALRHSWWVIQWKLLHPCKAGHRWRTLWIFPFWSKFPGEQTNPSLSLFNPIRDRRWLSLTVISCFECIKLFVWGQKEMTKRLGYAPLWRMAFGSTKKNGIWSKALLDGSSHRSLLDQNSWDLRSNNKKFNQGGKKTCWQNFFADLLPLHHSSTLPLNVFFSFFFIFMFLFAHMLPSAPFFLTLRTLKFPLYSAPCHFHYL